MFFWFKIVFVLLAVLPITHNCGSDMHKFEFWSTDSLSHGILTQAYFQSCRDSRWSFSASMKPDQQDSECKTLLVQLTSLTIFLSVMLIGLNVISGSCILKLIGQKFTSFLCYHFFLRHMFSLWLKTCHFYLAYTCEEALSSKAVLLIEILSEWNPVKKSEGQTA